MADVGTVRILLHKHDRTPGTLKQVVSLEPVRKRKSAFHTNENLVTQ
jgi:hypothetical protein